MKKTSARYQQGNIRKVPRANGFAWEGTTSSFLRQPSLQLLKKKTIRRPIPQAMRVCWT